MQSNYESSQSFFILTRLSFTNVEATIHSFSTIVATISSLSVKDYLAKRSEIDYRQKEYKFNTDKP
jgi:hypothetical protein